jgi:hypothetical protein
MFQEVRSTRRNRRSRHRVSMTTSFTGIRKHRHTRYGHLGNAPSITSALVSDCAFVPVVSSRSKVSLIVDPIDWTLKRTFFKSH